MTQTVVYQNGYLDNNLDYSKLFLFGNIFRQNTFYNATGGTLTYLPGTVLGRILSAGATQGYLVPCVSTATDGSQIPVCMLDTTITVATLGTATIMPCVSGEVDSSLLIFNTGDTLATVCTAANSGADTVPIGTFEDVLVGKGIMPRTVSDNTKYDNQ
jgi:hypothetical protein